MNLQHTFIRWLVAVVLCLPIAAISVPTYAAIDSDEVSVNAGTSLGTIPTTAFGLNTGVYDPHLMDSSVPSLLENADVGVLRFPGGSIADAYQWSTNSITNGYADTAPDYFTVAPGNSFNSFMGLTQKIGAQALITVNYGSNAAGTGGGDPQEAADWVQDANITNNDNVKYWEIGNEVYGNGTYDPGAPYGQGGHWELDLHSQIGPQAYANNALTYISDMKAVDPNIDVGVVLTAPSNWPDGQTPDWNSTVLSTDGAKINFVIVHWYPEQPGQENDADLLASPESGYQGTDSIAQMMSNLRSEINEYCGSNASNIQIFVTETNSVASNPGKQSVSLVNALFLDDDYMTWLENGAANVDWFALHNYINTTGNNSSTLYGSANYGDYGLLSDGSTANGISEPSAETPFPPYYGYQMLSYLAKPGDTMVSSSSSNNMVAVHAVKQANGDLALMLINKDPSNSYNVNISLSGYTPISTASEYTYGEGSNGIISTQDTGISNSFTQTIAPYSVTTVVMSPSTASPTFSDTTSVAPSTVSNNQNTLISTTFTDTSGWLSNGILDMEVYNSSGQQIAQHYVSGQNMIPNQSVTETWNLTVPSTEGVYTVKVGVFNSNWSTNYYWDNDAAPFNVTGNPTFSDSTNVSPANVTPNQATTITTQYIDQSGSISNGILDMEVYNSSGQRVAQQYLSGQNMYAGQSITETWNLSAPSNNGTYTVEVGVFNSNWGTNYYWNSNASTLTVS